MKYLKTFESENQLKSGYYVACEDNYDYSSEKYYNSERITFLKNFISNNVGQFTRRNYNNDVGEWTYMIKYDYIPKELQQHFTKSGNRYFREYQILFYSKNKEDVEEYLASKKYNL